MYLKLIMNKNNHNTKKSLNNKQIVFKYTSLKHTLYVSVK